MFSTPARAAPLSASNEPLYVIVFGYPLDKYSVTVEYFTQLGEATLPEPSNDLINAFRIGYRRPADAMRAVRKSGEVIGGSWMIGVKWEVLCSILFLLHILNRL
jgi:nuclear pore complex protein Nup53